MANLQSVDATPITAHMEIQIADAVQAEAADEILVETLSQTASYSGSNGVRVLQDSSDPRHLTIEMSWETAAHFDDYLAWRRSPDGSNRLREIIEGNSTIRRFGTRLTL